VCIVQIPHVTRVEYQLIDVSEDGFVRSFCYFFPSSSFATIFVICVGIFQVSLLTESGGTKDDLKLPTDDALNAHVCAVDD
jgi:translation initiation factor 5A